MNAYDLIVIGSGPAGEGAAMQAAKAKKRVAVVESYERVGGGCTHWGTIPSKALRHATQMLVELRRHPLLSSAVDPPNVPFARLLQSTDDVVRKQAGMRRSFYERNQVEVFQGHARFTDEHTLTVGAPGGVVETLSADAFLVATGSRPYRPPEIDFDHPRIFESDTILKLKRDPRSITIYGAGVIGCEYASIFRNFGIKVNLVNSRDKLLSFLDDEIIDALAYFLRDQGIIIRHNEEYERIEPLEDGVVLHLSSGKKLKTDILLWANGRTGNSQDMGLEALGVKADHRGHIPVNDSYQTTVPHLYAAGDVIGPPGLASASYDQGRAAAMHFVEGSCPSRSAHVVPAGIYTSPEISCIGRTEAELTKAKVPYEVGHAQFRSLARAQITGQTVGMLKLLFHRDSLALLGIHCFGDQAAEIIHIGQAVMTSGNNSLSYFANTTFNYPTMAEAYRVAALNGLNRLF
ncbi:MAG: Si-specific NAD(P)(+) transhydrogenase [Deltaproteobacteria bacterium]